MRRISVVLAAVSTALLGLAAPGSAATPGALTVRHVQQISRDSAPPRLASQPDTQTEPDIAADPNSPRTVVATYQQGRFRGGASVDPGYAWSHDAGATWHHANLPGLTRAVGGRFERASDPAVAFGPGGAVYISTLVLSFREGLSGVAVSRSDDGGVTFRAPVVVQLDSFFRGTHPRAFNDKNWITVDTFPGSPHYGRIYQLWDRLEIDQKGHPLTEPQVERYSDDRGRSWSKLIFVTQRAHVDTIGAQPVVQPDGTLTNLYTEFAARSPQLRAVTSTDGGLTFGSPVRVATYVPSGGPRGIRAPFFLPSATVDRVTGKIYVVFADARFRHDGAEDVVLSESADGRRWSPLRRVNTDRPGSHVDHFTADVAAYGGLVTVTWRSRIDASPLVKFQLTSGRGLSSFGPPVTLGPPADLRYAALAPVPFLGDYQGVSMVAGHTYAVWAVSSKPAGDARFHQTMWGASLS